MTIQLLLAARLPAAQGEHYVAAYNALAAELNDRLSVLSLPTFALKRVESGDGVTPLDLFLLRQKVRELMGLYFVVSPAGFQLDRKDEFEAFPWGLQYSNSQLVTPSLMDGIGANGWFTKVPASCVDGSNAVYAANFVDVPLLWVHFQELRLAIRRLVYTKWSGAWVAPDSTNYRVGDGSAWDWPSAKTAAEGVFNASGLQSVGAPFMLSSADHWRSGNRVYVAGLNTRRSQFRVSNLPVYPHRVLFYNLGSIPPPDPYYATVRLFDPNGHSIQLDRWSLWSASPLSTAAALSSDSLGSDSPPAWCAEPAPGGVSIRGFTTAAAVPVVEWTFSTQPMRQPMQIDSGDDGLCVAGCECAECPPNADTQWMKLWNRPLVKFPVGISSGLQTAGVRVKAYVTEYEIDGATRQMFSLDTRVLSDGGDPGAGWWFVVVKRPGGAEVVIPTTGRLANKPINVRASYRLKRTAQGVSLVFPHQDNLVHQYGANGLIAGVIMRFGHSAVPVSGSPDTWPGLRVTRDGSGRAISCASPSLTSTLHYRSSNLVGRVSYASPQGRPLAQVEYAPGSKRFTLRDPDGIPLDESRVVTNAAGDTAIWRGVTTNPVVSVAFKETRTEILDGGTGLRYVTHVDTLNPDRADQQSRTNTTAFTELLQGEDVASRTFAAGTPDEQITRYSYVPEGQNGETLPGLIESFDGSWTRYTYDGLDRVTLQQTPFMDSGPADTGSCRSVRSVYLGDSQLAALAFTDLDTGQTNDPQPRLVIESIGAVEVARTYHAFLADRVITRRCRTAGAPYDAADSEETVAFHMTSGPFLGRPIRLEHPDGTRTLTSYAYDAVLERLTTTSDSGVAAGSTVTNGLRTVTIQDAAGLLLEERRIDIASGAVLSHVLNQRDEFGRITASSNLVDGTCTRTTYTCCGPETVLDAEGIETTNHYNELKQVFAVERGGVTEFAERDVGGAVVATRRSAPGADDLIASNAFDSAGRPIAEFDPLGRLTAHAYTTNALGEPVTTTTLPDGSTRVETCYRDGQIKSIGGTAVRPSHYLHGADADGRFTTVFRGADTNAAEWEQTWTDMLGRPWKTRFSDGYEQITRYDGAGRPIEERDGLTRTLHAYDLAGSTQCDATDMDDNGIIDAAGSDRISETRTAWEWIGGTAVERTITRIWPEAGSARTTIAREHCRSADAASAWTVSFGRTSRTDIVRSPEAATRTQTTTGPDGVRTISTYTNGLLASVERRAADGRLLAVRHPAYDPHGRLTGIREPAPNGTTREIRIARDAAGRMTSRTVRADGRELTTHYEYDSLDHCVRETRPDGGVIESEYAPTGELLFRGGTGTYPARYTYNASGRLETLATYRSGIRGTADVTRWSYDSARGWPTGKTDAAGATVAFAYRRDGRLAERLWGRGVRSRYAYDASGALTNTSYSDGTADVSLAPDRAGRVVCIADGTGIRSNHLDDAGLLLSADGPGAHAELAYAYDSLARRTNVTIRFPGGESFAVLTMWDDAGRLDAVSAGPHRATYAYAQDGVTVAGLTTAAGTGSVASIARDSDGFGRVGRITCSASGATALEFSCAHDDAGRLLRCDREDGGWWEYGYDVLGQVTSAVRRLAGGAELAAGASTYAYDSIGNRVAARLAGEPTPRTYGPTALNQYAQMTAMTGSRDPLRGTVFMLDGGNIVAPADACGSAAVPRTVTFGYDADGNMTSDCDRVYTWDAENRLLSVEPAALTAGSFRVEFTYDGSGRRTGKTAYRRSAGAWARAYESRFVYDGWNLVAEIIAPADGPARTNVYAWGLDVGEQGGAPAGPAPGTSAGGVGGLLFGAALDATTTAWHYVSDAHGNVMGVFDPSGNLTARHDYDPYGNPLPGSSPPLPGAGFGHSSKMLDTETGLEYYGRRYYSATLGRWLSRDPAGEEGGLNLQGFIRNTPPNAIDPLGLALYAFDGTGADRNTWTHVSILYRSYLRTARYKEGVGSRLHSWLLGGYAGLGGQVRLERMYEELVQIYESGDHEIDIIGFSRGAALAREFANMIYEQGIVDTSYGLASDPNRPVHQKQAVSSRIIDCSPRIRFVGLFDTVGSFGIPGNSINFGIRMALPPNVQHAVQAVARHERRSAFPLTPLGSPNTAQDFSEAVFDGDHSDIGGGHGEDQNLLALEPLLYVWSRGRSVGVPFGPLHLVWDRGQLFLEVNGERRPWPYTITSIPHDLTKELLFRDGGPRDNLPGGTL